MKEEYAAREELSLKDWGTNAYGRAFIDQEAVGGHFISAAERTFGLLSRHLVTPDVAMEISRLWYEVDVRELLPSVRLPTLVIAFEEPAELREEAEYVSSLLPNAKLELVAGEEIMGDSDDLLDTIVDFVGVDRRVGLELDS